MKLPKPLSFLLRAAITAGAAYLAFSQVSLQQVLPLLRRIPAAYLLAALILVHVGQFISALRTRYYLHCQGIDLPVDPSVRLHYVGGLFNVFLPGGAGGDVYKAWWLKRHKQGALLSMAKVMIASRLNGLWALGILICLLGLLSDDILRLHAQAPWLIVVAAIAGTIGYSILARLILKEPFTQQRQAGLYSLLLQLMLVGASAVLCVGLGQQDHVLEYVVLFLLSCMLAMLPVSIGGIGVRELALLHGSRLLGLSEETGVTLAFSYTLLTLTIALVGMVIHHCYAPEQEKQA